MSIYAAQKNVQGINARAAESDLQRGVSGIPVQAVDTSSHAKIRQIYAVSLDSMKSAHLNAFYQMKQAAAPSSEGIPLTSSFSSFQPCPLKLTLTSLCKESLNLQEFPEIFSGLEEEFIFLRKQYQKLSSNVKQQLFEELVEGDFSERLDFNRLLDEIVDKIKVGTNVSSTSPLISVFKQDVDDAKGLMDFLTWSIQLDSKVPSQRGNHILSADILLMRALSSVVRTGKFPAQPLKILNSFFSKVTVLKEKYDALDAISKFSLDHELQYGRLGTNFEPRAERIFKEIEKTITDIKSNNRNLMPLLVFLAHKQAQGHL